MEIRVMDERTAMTILEEVKIKSLKAEEIEFIKTHKYTVLYSDVENEDVFFMQELHSIQN